MAVYDGYAHAGDTIRIKTQFPNVSGSFDSGLSPTIDIIRDSDGSLLVDGAAMTAFPNMPDVYYYDYVAIASGFLTIKTYAGDGRTGIAYWIIGTGVLPDVTVSPTSSADLVDDIWDEILSGNTHNTQNSAGKRLRDIASQTIWTGTAQGAGTDNNQIQLDTNASSLDGAYDPAIVAIVDGTGAGQCRLILQYNGATKVATVDRGWKVQPDDTSEFIIYADPGREHVNEGLAQAGTASSITLNANASSSDDNYINQLVFIRSGTGEDQVRRVTDYNGTTKVATVSPDWIVTPDATSAYVMLAATLPDLSAFALEETSQEILSAIHAIDIGLGDGVIPTTFTVTDSVSSSPIPAVRVEAWNESGTLRMAVGITNTEGAVVLNLDEGVYAPRLWIAGWSFTLPATIAVDADNNAFSFEGLEISAGVPSDTNLCRVSLLCFDPQGQNPLPVVSAVAYIINLPFEAGGKFHSGDNIVPLYNSSTGVLYWDLPQTADVRFVVKEEGIDVERTIPAANEAYLKDLI